MGAPFVWFDLTVADGATIAGFYQGLFGWESGPAAESYLGGSVIRDKLTGPAGNSVIVADPGGALIALFTPAAG